MPGHTGRQEHVQPPGSTAGSRKSNRAGSMSAQVGSGASPTRIGGGSSKPTIAAAPGRVDSHAVTKRLQSELMALMSGSDSGISAFPDGESLFAWAGTIHGAVGTVYEGLSYKLSLKFPTGAQAALVLVSPAALNDLFHHLGRGCMQSSCPPRSLA